VPGRISQTRALNPLNLNLNLSPSAPPTVGFLPRTSPADPAEIGFLVILAYSERQNAPEPHEFFFRKLKKIDFFIFLRRES
jgi:hypothetical protein